MVSDIPAGDRKIVNLYYGVYCIFVYLGFLPIQVFTHPVSARVDRSQSVKYDIFQRVRKSHMWCRPILSRSKQAIETVDV